MLGGWSKAGLMSLAVALAACSTAASAPPRAPAAGSSWSAGERDSLLAGATVARPLTIEQGGARAIGGIAYQLVRATPEEVLGTLQSVQTLPQALPNTHSARLVGIDGQRAFVELVQGNSVAQVSYTIQLARTGEHELKFWLDPSRPHDIENVWGFFRAEPFEGDQTLVTMAVALDLGPGLARMLFEERIRQVILDAPRLLRDFVEPRALAGAY